MSTTLESFKELLKQNLTPTLEELCMDGVLSIPEFLKAPASLGFHHTYDGGLLEHTYEVVKYALKASFGENVNHEILLTAAVFHDYAKIFEYIPAPMSYDSNWIQDKRYCSQIGHVTGSVLQFQRMANKFSLSSHFIGAVTHCILAHHGRREWGSPVEPQTAEALMLHQADMWSANHGLSKTCPIS